MTGTGEEMKGREGVGSCNGEGVGYSRLPWASY